MMTRRGAWRRRATREGASRLSSVLRSGLLKLALAGNQREVHIKNERSQRQKEGSRVIVGALVLGERYEERGPAPGGTQTGGYSGCRRRGLQSADGSR